MGLPYNLTVIIYLPFQMKMWNYLSTISKWKRDWVGWAQQGTI